MCADSSDGTGWYVRRVGAEKNENDVAWTCDEPDSRLIVEAVNSYDALKAENEAMRGALEGVSRRRYTNGTGDGNWHTCWCDSPSDHSPACKVAATLLSRHAAGRENK